MFYGNPFSFSLGGGEEGGLVGGVQLAVNPFEGNIIVFHEIFPSLTVFYSINK